MTAAGDTPLDDSIAELEKIANELESAKLHRLVWKFKNAREQLLEQAEEVAGAVLPSMPPLPSPAAVQRVQAALSLVLNEAGRAEGSTEGYAIELLRLGEELGKGPASVVAALGWVAERTRGLRGGFASLKGGELGAVILTAIRNQSSVPEPRSLSEGGAS